MNDEQLLRYNRHILLEGLDVAGQERITLGRVLLIGAGGLGCPAALYLVAAGIGEITVVDADIVDKSNLQRQVAYSEADLNRPKSAVLVERVRGLHAGLRANAIVDRVDEELLDHLVPMHDVLVDATDNFPTRHLINRHSRAFGVPLVSGAAIRWEGQLSVFDPRDPACPCYACLYPEQGDDALSCAEAGVFSPLVGTIGSLMAGEVLKVLVGESGTLTGRLLVMDQRAMEMRTLKLGRDEKCRVCGAGED